MHIPRFLLTLTAAGLLPLLAQASDLTTLIVDGDRRAALAAVRAGADVNALQADGSSPLLVAVNRIDHELVRELLQRGADPDIRNSFGATALGEALALGDIALTGMLLQAGADPNLGNDDNQTPLMLAARLGSLPLVEALVKAGARVNEREQYRDQSALMWAVGANSPEVVDFLIQHKAEVELRAAANDWGNQMTSEPRTQYRDAGGLTPLLFATRSGCLGCVQSLLKAGVDINRPTPDGVTPLMNAIDNNNHAIANYLLDQGADPHRFDWWSRTALYLSVDMRSRGGGRGGGGGGPGGPGPGGPAGVRFTEAPGAAPQFSTLQVMQRLLEMGVDPNPQLNMHRPFRGRFTDDLINTGCTPLLRAAISADSAAVELLLRHGALPDLPNVMGVTPLMAAAAMGAARGLQQGGQGPIGPQDSHQANAITVIGMLIKAGADVNARVSDTSSRTAIIARPNSMTDRQGQTALFGAVSQNWTQVARYLIDNGARADIKDAAGKTLADALEGKAGGRDTPTDRPEPAPEEMVKLITEAMGR
jgi:ankyrin repeat protein